MPCCCYIHTYGSTLPENGILCRGFSLITDSGRVEFRVTTDGNLELLGDGKKLWSVEGQNASYVKMQTDGNCVGYRPDGTVMWQSNTVGNGHLYSLVVQEDGNLVVYAKGGTEAVWDSNTQGRVQGAGFTYPWGDTLPENGLLGRGYALISKNERVEFRVLDNGNLELIGDGKTLWSIEGKKAGFVVVQSDGNLCGYTCEGANVWATMTNGNAHPYQLICQGDGNLVVYAAGGRPVWNSNTAVIH
ncbi:hypothetical protein E1B28_001883 [Marasmius oreades]|uniref:Bulb-type lectin domain-containing protein n=1 Tax=Marasmius oreades TaxID=181124 RepID=A0A9P7V4E1_9AGAR|nr:uncharacterized protein E1B28_001883 [Marasmius oreades]KAG7100103.1 hypothetical protein E1B28_001883 [Marasmius oreades]